MNLASVMMSVFLQSKTAQGFENVKAVVDAIAVPLFGIWMLIGVIKVVKAYNNEEQDAQKKLVNVIIAAAVFFGYTLFIADLQEAFNL